MRDEDETYFDVIKIVSSFRWLKCDYHGLDLGFLW